MRGPRGTTFQYVRENPNSANTYDSLAEAYLTRDVEGDKQRALANYRTVLDPRRSKPQGTIETFLASFPLI